VSIKDRQAEKREKSIRQKGIGRGYLLGGDLGNSKTRKAEAGREARRKGKIISIENHNHGSMGTGGWKEAIYKATKGNEMKSRRTEMEEKTQRRKNKDQ